MKHSSLWTWHILAALVILVLLGMHMGIMHLDGVLPLKGFNPAADSPLDWANVVHRGRQLAFTVTYILLLGAALFHGLYGLRNILFELNPSAGMGKAISAVLLLVGAGLFVVGTWAAVAARATALAS